MPALALYNEINKFFLALIKPFYAYSASMTEELPLHLGEWGNYTVYNVEHLGNPTKDYSAADLWHDKSFLLMLVLGWFLLQAALA